MRRVLSLAISTAAVAACTTAPRVPPTASAPVDVQLVTDEPEAALAIIRRHAAGQEPTRDEWGRLYASRGYRHLKEREAAMQRPFTDSSFAAFLVADSVARRADSLDAALRSLERIDVSAPASRAFAYLPAGARLRARLYLEIKPRTNTFVFTGRDSVPSIFLYVNPGERPAQLENTMAHELHHIGLSASCHEPESGGVTPAERMLLVYLTAFGEGEAMLAAAGGPDVHPHAADDDSIQRRWDRDVANAPADIAELSRFFASVLDHRVTSADSVVAQASSYFGVQGPWYTVGWLMASTVEREDGRAALLGALCEPTQLLVRYDDAARRADARGARLPRWDSTLVGRLVALRKRAGG